MRKFKHAAFAAATLLTSLSVHAQATEIKLGSGGPTGNYFSMAKDIANYCNDDLSDASLSVLNSGGSVDNLMGMGNKVYSVGIVQEDVLNYHAKRSPRKVNKNRLQVISGLHEEAIHLLIPKDYQPESAKKGWIDSLFKDKTAPKISLSMLKDQKVGSWGGSIVSSEALSYFFKLNLKVIDIPEDKRAQVNLPLILVGGHPYKPVEELLQSGRYHLVALNYHEISEQAGFYSKQVVNYQINGKVTGVPTVGVRALLLGKSFRKASRNTHMSELATCISDNIADLADDPDTNPLWSSVYDFIEDEGQVDWSYFPLLEDTAQTTDYKQPE